jgi:hypothetical protein
MSHVVTVQTQFRNLTALAEACKQLGYEFRGGKHSVKLYSGAVECEASVTIPGWRFPVAVNGDNISFDNYGGSWGKQELLDKLKQAYGREVTIQEAKDMGMFVEEKQLQDGTIELYLTE